jgi:hypothetical protein
MIESVLILAVFAVMFARWQVGVAAVALVAFAIWVEHMR